MAAIQVFSCPNCSETINTTMQECGFCHVPIDAAAAMDAAATMSKINEACSDASYIKIVAGMMGTFLLVRFIPFVGMIGTTGFLLMLFATPVLAIRWWVKYGSIKTTDPEFARARKITLVLGIVVSVFLVTVLVLVLVLFRAALKVL